MTFAAPLKQNPEDVCTIRRDPIRKRNVKVLTEAERLYDSHNENNAQFLLYFKYRYKTDTKPWTVTNVSH